jgi:hypothetical protein
MINNNQPYLSMKASVFFFLLLFSITSWAQDKHTDSLLRLPVDSIKDISIDFTWGYDLSDDAYQKAFKCLAGKRGEEKLKALSQNQILERLLKCDNKTLNAFSFLYSMGSTHITFDSTDYRKQMISHAPLLVNSGIKDPQFHSEDVKIIFENRVPYLAQHINQAFTHKFQYRKINSQKLGDLKSLSLKITINTMQITPDSAAPKIIGNLILSINNHQLVFSPGQYSVFNTNKGTSGHEDAKFLEVNMIVKDWYKDQQ